MESDFTEWWNEKFFNRTPLYAHFRKLHAAQADLDYILWLCRQFYRWHYQHEEQRAKARSKPKKKRDRIPHKTETMDTRSVFIFGSNLIEFTVGYLMQHGLIQQTKDTLDIIPPEARVKIIRDTATHTSGADLWLPVLQKLAEEIMQEREDIERETFRRDQEQKKLAPFLHVVSEYQPISHDRGGRKPDTWGSFFLLAVTEHVREKSGTPKYTIAQNLLNTLKKAVGQNRNAAPRENNSSPYSGRRKATIKVAELKKKHVLWRSHLKITELTSQLAQLSSKNGYPPVPWIPDWLTPRNTR